MKDIQTKHTDWSFSNIPNGFDSHVREQLPWYDMTLDLISFIVRNYVPVDGRIYDIGSSTGNLKRKLAGTIDERSIEYITIDNTPEMNADIVGDAVTIQYEKFDIAIMNLTLMFIPVKHRKILMDNLIKNMNVGGCIILVDKFIQPEDYLSTVLRRATLFWKQNNGVDCSDIVNKELSLSGIQIPLYYHELPENSKQFFQFGEFSGHIIQKYPRRLG